MDGIHCMDVPGTGFSLALSPQWKKHYLARSIPQASLAAQTGTKSSIIMAMERFDGEDKTGIKAGGDALEAWAVMALTS